MIPVEQSPERYAPSRPHVMQLVVQCLLVEDVYGVCPQYGVLVLAEGVQERVVYCLDLEQRVLATIAQLQELPALDTET